MQLLKKLSVATAVAGGKAFLAGVKTDPLIDNAIGQLSSKLQ